MGLILFSMTTSQELLNQASSVAQQQQQIQTSRAQISEAMNQVNAFEPNITLTPQQIKQQDINQMYQLRQAVVTRGVAKGEQLAAVQKASQEFEAQAGPAERQLSDYQRQIQNAIEQERDDERYRNSPEGIAEAMQASQQKREWQSYVNTNYGGDYDAARKAGEEMTTKLKDLGLTAQYDKGGKLDSYYDSTLNMSYGPSLLTQFRGSEADLQKFAEIGLIERAPGPGYTYEGTPGKGYWTMLEMPENRALRNQPRPVTNADINWVLQNVKTQSERDIAQGLRPGGYVQLGLGAPAPVSNTQIIQSMEMAKKIGEAEISAGLGYSRFTPPKQLGLSSGGVLTATPESNFVTRLIMNPKDIGILAMPGNIAGVPIGLTYSLTRENSPIYSAVAYGQEKASDAKTISAIARALPVPNTLFVPANSEAMQKAKEIAVATAAAPIFFLPSTPTALAETTAIIAATALGPPIVGAFVGGIYASQNIKTLRDNPDLPLAPKIAAGAGVVLGALPVLGVIKEAVTPKLARFTEGKYFRATERIRGSGEYLEPVLLPRASTPVVVEQGARVTVNLPSFIRRLPEDIATTTAFKLLPPPIQESTKIAIFNPTPYDFSAQLAKNYLFGNLIEFSSGNKLSSTYAYNMNQLGSGVDIRLAWAGEEMGIVHSGTGFAFTKITGESRPRPELVAPFYGSPESIGGIPQARISRLQLGGIFEIPTPVESRGVKYNFNPLSSLKGKTPMNLFTEVGRIAPENPYITQLIENVRERKTEANLNKLYREYEKYLREDYPGYFGAFSTEHYVRPEIVTATKNVLGSVDSTGTASGASLKSLFGEYKKYLEETRPADVKTFSESTVTPQFAKNIIELTKHSGIFTGEREVILPAGSTQYRVYGNIRSKGFIPSPLGILLPESGGGGLKGLGVVGKGIGNIFSNILIGRDIFNPSNRGLYREPIPVELATRKFSTGGDIRGLSYTKLTDTSKIPLGATSKQFTTDRSISYSSSTLMSGGKITGSVLSRSRNIVDNSVFSSTNRMVTETKFAQPTLLGRGNVKELRYGVEVQRDTSPIQVRRGLSAPLQGPYGFSNLPKPLRALESAGILKRGRFTEKGEAFTLVKNPNLNQALISKLYNINRIPVGELASKWMSTPQMVKATLSEKGFTFKEIKNVEYAIAPQTPFYIIKGDIARVAAKGLQILQRIEPKKKVEIIYTETRGTTQSILGQKKAILQALGEDKTGFSAPIETSAEKIYNLQLKALGNKLVMGKSGEISIEQGRGRIGGLTKSEIAFISKETGIPEQVYYGDLPTRNPRTFPTIRTSIKEPMRFSITERSLQPRSTPNEGTSIITRTPPREEPRPEVTERIITPPPRTPTPNEPRIDIPDINIRITPRVPPFNPPRIDIPEIPVETNKYWRKKKEQLKPLARLRSKAYQAQVRRYGKFFNVGMPTTMSKALKLGSEKTQATLAATFRVVPTNVNTTDEDFTYKVNMNVFRPPKRATEQPLTFVQRKGGVEGAGKPYGARLASYGERVEIQQLRAQSKRVEPFKVKTGPTILKFRGGKFF